MVEEKFQKLTPTDDVDLKVYEDSFKFIFDNDDIRNVAISGPYCSGKSSIIQTYEIRHPKKKFVHVSLTHFKNNDTNGSNNNADEDIESVIEAKITNQLIQQIPSKNIPNTGFKIKHEASKGKIFVITIGITFLIFTFLYFLFNKELTNWVLTIPSNSFMSFFSILNNHVFQLIIIFIACCIGFVVIYKIVSYLSNRNIFQRLRLKDAEFDIVSDEDKSYFDKHLDELLYLLRKSDADVIVFEDIDRYNNHIEIFEKLREINTLVNLRDDQKNDKGRKTIRFFYLLGDDVFTSIERTKFFDFIIPVIPVIDGSNSYNKLKGYLQDLDIFNMFDDHFLRQICLYLNDLRLVKNIVNEFIIYEKKLGIIQLDYNKLLAIIIYKNTFPADYVALQNRSGYVYKLFDDSNKANLRNKKQGPKLKLAERINGNLNSQIFDVTDTNELGRQNDFNDVKDNEYFSLLKYLIAYGYIDETYEDYITFFYDNVLTIRDKDFCRAVIAGDILEYDYHLNNVNEVVNTLDFNDFMRPGILNYDLLNYLLQPGENQEDLSEIICQIKGDRNFEFVTSYFDVSIEKEKFVTILNDLWPEFFSTIYTEQDYKPKDFLRSYSLYTLLLSSKDKLEHIDEDGCLSTYISSQPDYLNLDLEVEYIEQFVNALKIIDVKFYEIDVNISNNLLLDRIYQLNLYEINPQNIRAFLRIKYNDMLQSLYTSKYYTIIFSKSNEPLCKYLEEWPEVTLRVILDMIEGQANDDEQIVIYILNNIEISEELRQEYLSINSTLITSLKSIKETSFYEPLIERKTVKYSADNILQFYSVNGFTKVLQYFINFGTGNLNYVTAHDFNEVNTKQFFKDSIDAEDLNNQRFQEIAEQLGYELPQLNQFKPALDKVLILAKLGEISFSPNNLTYIRNQYPEALQVYICADPENSIDKLLRSFTKEEVEEILSWNEVPDPNKISLLNRNQNDKYTVLNENYPEEVVKEILTHHRNDNDLPELYIKFDDYSADIQDTIFNIANNSRNSIIQSRQELAFSLLKRFLYMKNLNFNTKIDLIQSQTNHLSDDEIIVAVKYSGCQEVAHAVRPNTKKSVEITDENEKALKLFKETKIIIDYSKDTETGKFFIHLK